jgi:serine/threonine protein kinase
MCPSEEDLRNYLDENVGEADQSRIEAHLQDCARCFEVLQTMADMSVEGIADILRRPLLEPARADFPGDELRRRVNDVQLSRYFDTDESSLRGQSLVTTGVPCDEDEFSTYMKRNAAELITRTHSLLETGHRFELRETLGSGGMGSVRLIYDRDLHRQVALKAPNRPHSLTRFIREAQIVAQLEHPNILPIYDFGLLTESELAITMPVVAGTTLKHYLARVKGEDRLEQLPFLIDVLLKVCDAVSYAHSRGVVHGDITPSNVLIGKYGEVYLIDWGLAIGPDDQHEVPLGAGTPQYMAPEQLIGNSKADVHTDVFGLGGALYEILFDRPPNSGHDLVSIRCSSRLGERERSFTTKDWPVPEGLVRVCRRALRANVNDRYPCAIEMGEAIRNARYSHMFGASIRVIAGLVIGIAVLTLSTVGLIASLTGYFAIHWSFWAAFVLCSLGLSIATLMEATGRDTSLLKRQSPIAKQPRRIDPTLPSLSRRRVPEEQVVSSERS